MNPRTTIVIWTPLLLTWWGCWGSTRRRISNKGRFGLSGSPVGLTHNPTAEKRATGLEIGKKHGSTGHMGRQNQACIPGRAVYQAATPRQCGVHMQRRLIEFGPGSGPAGVDMFPVVDIGLGGGNRPAQFRLGAAMLGVALAEVANADAALGKNVAAQAIRDIDVFRGDGYGDVGIGAAEHVGGGTPAMLRSGMDFVFHLFSPALGRGSMVII